LSVGKRVLTMRLKSKMTQQELSERTGLAVSYLSRLENERIVPSIRTLRKVAEAFGVPLTNLFENEHRKTGAESCSVSPSGSCIMNHLTVGRGRKPKESGETYSPQQLEVLRLCNLLLQSEDREVISSMSTLMKSLLALVTSREPVNVH
jgi:transcriptional regulator with XRE-family HTH domain